MQIQLGHTIAFWNGITHAAAEVIVVHDEDTIDARYPNGDTLKQVERVVGQFEPGRTGWKPIQ